MGAVSQPGGSVFVEIHVTRLYDPGNALWLYGYSTALCYGIDSHAVLSSQEHA